MKNLTLLVVSAAMANLSLAQSPEPAAPTATGSKLKPEQAASVLKQLQELEKTILAQRGSNLGGIIQKIRSAASSDAAALALVAECDSLVNVERKEGDRDDKEAAERRKDQQKNAQQNTDQDDVERNGDPLLALRLCLEYLALSLEAQEVKELSDMAGKLTSFHQSLVSSGAKLRGRSGDVVLRPVGNGGGGGGGGRRQGGQQPSESIGLVIQAFQLENYLKREGWPLVPGDILEHYEKIIFTKDRASSPDKLAEHWDAAIAAESAFRKARMFEGEYALWFQTAVPDLRWDRAADLAEHGTNSITGLAEMLNIIKANPNHPNSPKWVAELRARVEKDQGTAPSAPAP
ncbi:MAG: hypothetical protein JNJ83_04010 [Verrucomicrobiaceae bacterium]|nr:hypothetical protein [Verrucomicrobiaceae bacterium]